MALATVLALVMFLALVAYTLLAGADFGAGVWDLLSRGPRRDEEQQRITEAIGPVWEANHVWLIFLIVLLFTCFPPVYAAISVALFWPLHLVLIGIVLRGASFVFRAYGATGPSMQTAWGHVFGAASAVTPVLLGMCLGAVSTGAIRVSDDGVVTSDAVAWLAPFPIAAGILALLLCAYIAAVYLAWESEAELREDFRRRALVTWLLAGAASVITLLAVRLDAPHLWANLVSMPAILFLAAGALLAPASLAALRRGHFQAARFLGGGQVTALLGGWGVAQWPYLVYPDLTVQNGAAPPPTLLFTAASLPLGLVLLVPSLWYLFAVFKGRNPRAAGAETGR